MVYNLCAETFPCGKKNSAFYGFDVFLGLSENPNGFIACAERLLYGSLVHKKAPFMIIHKKRSNDKTSQKAHIQLYLPLIYLIKLPNLSARAKLIHKLESQGKFLRRTWRFGPLRNFTNMMTNFKKMQHLYLRQT